MSSAEENLSLFFDKTWGDTEAYAYLPTRSAANTWENVFFKWPEHKPHVIKHVMGKAAASYEVYFSPALYAEPKMGKDYVLGSRVLWADFDGAEAGTPAPSTWADLPAAVPEPSLRVQTSSPENQHVYWDLGEFVTDTDKIEQINRSIAYTLNSDTACWNKNRLMRPPMTTNFGYSKPERKGVKFDVDMVELSERVEPIDKFAHLKGLARTV